MPDSHPASCRICGGTNFQPGQPIPGHHLGRSFNYTTSEPCTHRWFEDDVFVDEYGLDRIEVLTFHQYLVALMARVRRGDPRSIAELDGWERANRTFPNS